MVHLDLAGAPAANGGAGGRQATRMHRHDLTVSLVGAGVVGDEDRPAV
jgi:hypothetical protein